jgi:transposase-like protein
MRQKANTNAQSSEELVKGIRRATRKRYSAEEKIRIVLDGLRGEHSIAELCRRTRPHQDHLSSPTVRSPPRYQRVAVSSDNGEINRSPMRLCHSPHAQFLCS